MYFAVTIDFVPCVGANRRRMNILSDIVRPNDQLCTIVQFDWAEFFGDKEDNNASSNDSMQVKEL